MRVFDISTSRLKREQIPINFPEKIDQDLDSLILSPLFVDLHTHVRLNDEEDYDTLSHAALAGGFGVCVIQPNTRPPIENLDVLKNHVELSKGKDVHFLHTISLFGEINDLNELRDYTNNIAGFSTDGIRYTSPDLIKAFSEKKRALVFDHSQLHEVPGDFYIGSKVPNAVRTYSNEAIAIFRTVLTGLEFGFNRFHIQHVSTSQSLEAIEYLRKKTKVTCEVTPHHVFFCPEEINNPNQKINPPISKDRDILVDAVKKGIITCFATDHAPHPEKPADFERAPYGSSHIEVAFSVYLKVFEDIELVLKNLTINPLSILGKSYEELGFSFPNDAVLIDEKAEYTVESTKFFSKGKNCAFNGYRLKGKVLGIRRNGRWVFWNGEFLR
uniref:Dihydroorotase n=1 Tax=Fervidobacterium pennivorans TaxID=93466 RepID=A0A7V4KEV6_FERPE